MEVETVKTNDDGGIIFFYNSISQCIESPGLRISPTKIFATTKMREIFFK